MLNKKIKAVLFDFGETLVNFGKVNTAQLFKKATRSTYNFLCRLRQPVGNFYYYRWRTFASLRMHYWLSGITGRDFDSLALLKKIGSEWKLKLNEQQWDRLAWLWYEPLSKKARTEPDTLETLTRLRNCGLKLGIVSNTFINASPLDSHLAQLGLLDFFPVRVYSYKFKFRKPDKRIFNVAAERIGRAASEVLFVGDRLDIDIKGARNAGMQTVLKNAYTNIDKKIPPGLCTIARLSELPALIEKINAASDQR